MQHRPFNTYERRGYTRTKSQGLSGSTSGPPCVARTPLRHIPAEAGRHCGHGYGYDSGVLTDLFPTQGVPPGMACGIF